MFNASNDHFDHISKIKRPKINPFSKFRDGYIGKIGIILAIFIAIKQNNPYENMLSNTDMVIFVLLINWRS